VVIFLLLIIITIIYVFLIKVNRTAMSSFKGHLGQDYYVSGQDSLTVGKPVYAVSNGRVVQVIDNTSTTYGWDDSGHHGWGRVVVIEHVLPAGLNTDESTMVTEKPNEKNPKIVYSLYGHLAKDSILVNTDEKVLKGEQIAKIAKVGVDYEGDRSHLHFEIKNSVAYAHPEQFKDNKKHYCCGAQPTLGIGFGYSYSTNYSPNRYIPSEFIKRNLVINNALIQIEGQQDIYWLQNKKIYKVIDIDTINRMSGLKGWSFSEITIIPNIAPYTDSGKTFIEKNGNSNKLLIKVGNTDNIYEIVGNSIEKILSPVEFENKGYDWRDVIIVSDSIKQMFTPTNENISFEVGEGPVPDSVRQAFISTWSDSNSDLGVATGIIKDTISSASGVNGYYQTYANGSIQYFVDGPFMGHAFSIYGSIYRKWGELGYANNPIGFPTSNRLTAKSSFDNLEEYQSFENGRIQINKFGVFAVYNEIYLKWESIGLEAGVLGFPIGDLINEGVQSGFGTFGSYQRFQGGSIQLTSDGSFAVFDEIYEEWRKHGFAGTNGYPVGESIENAQTSWVGFPTSDRTACYEGECQYFEGGYIWTDGLNSEFVSSTHPTNLSYSINPDASVSLMWENRVLAQGINVYRASSPAEKIETLNPNDESYTDYTAEEGKLYTYFISAFNETDESEYSNQVVSNPVLNNGPWPMLGHDMRHTGRSTNKEMGGPFLKWQYEMNGYIHSSPAIGTDGSIYVGSNAWNDQTFNHEGSIHAINPDGSNKWKYNTSILHELENNN